MLVLRVRFAVAAIVYAGLFLSVSMVAPALAQVDPSLQGPILKGPADTRPELPAPEREDDESILPGRTLPRIQIPEDDPSASALSGGEISVQSFRFVGNTALSDAELEAIVRPYIGEGRRYSALLEARDRVTRAYIDAGFISSGAVLPAQDFVDGTVELEIVEGQLTQIEVETDG
ncbi:MAG: hypothetical protein JRG89_05670, partial [Deltaproteobacteria bacterium]|nr:hypothetical protein [Deltaproteobacteria bacterium]